VETPIARELDHFIKLVSGIAIASGLLFFVIDFIYGYGIITNISYMIGIIVANVPEGLLITVTVCMALAAQRMAARRVLVKNLQSVETLGSTSCICSDKTGTLTQNKMTASHMFYSGKIIDISTNYEEFTRKGTEITYKDEI
jgi:sodium/potassium-transporting ATPase subunit alpha